ncbi:signal peptidase II [Rheinheimera baltica]|uniref:Lipoprotein signal peptidase n=1 Tax=Rheinheimera baltica TaxID=67576 RepID=A0ABT9I0R4_9GAMM|nr:signal peptidase II [Rheinheimera baltica]MDP5136987.1 signal peptidase II [Rheinheimera baltica]MDP5141950.1 signal peptidase II [Rheinheimera baltica]MDP5150061.1 signal peptidase II [Rheinheimera baltica]MDP5189124.1 signal peptidase II [Rheinheimera baltica]
MTLFKDTGWRLWWLMLLLVLADQLTKQVVIANMQLFESIELLPFFNFTYVRNYGAAFSFLSDAGGWQRWFFTFIAVAISCVLAVWLARNNKEQLKLNLALSLVLAGAIGNLIDRSVYGYVIDFLHVYYQNWHYPAFNIADSAICIGAGLLIWDSFSSNEVKK